MVLLREIDTYRRHNFVASKAVFSYAMASQGVLTSLASRCVQSPSTVEYRIMP